MKKFMTGLGAIALLASPALAGSNTFHVTGQGTLNDGRVFSVNARIDKNGTATGHAVLINQAFSGDSGNGPFRAQIDISCINVLDDGEVYLGGVARSNDSTLDGEAVYFAVSDDGRLSRAFFFDDNPATTGDPGLCQFNTAGNFPLENVIRGNIHVQ